MKFKHLNCPVCGRQLVNLMSEEARKAGFHHFWCDVCDIDVNIDENKIPLCDDEEI
jgi:transcription elongation factor Elf1